MNLRSSVKQFAQAMERKLRENDHKGGWDETTDACLIERLFEEANELSWAMSRVGDGPPPDPHRVVDECADVANFAMMIADKARKDRL